MNTKANSSQYFQSTWRKKQKYHCSFALNSLFRFQLSQVRMLNIYLFKESAQLPEYPENRIISLYI